MLKKLERKKIDKQESQQPQNIEQLIEYYNLENLWQYIDSIVDYINEKEV